MATNPVSMQSIECRCRFVVLISGRLGDLSLLLSIAFTFRLTKVRDLANV